VGDCCCYCCSGSDVGSEAAPTGPELGVVAPWLETLRCCEPSVGYVNNIRIHIKETEVRVVFFFYYPHGMHK
jgi:hypothetical protein